MTIKKTNPTKPGSVDLTAEELQDEDLDRAIHGGIVVDPAANWDMFASGPKGSPKIVSTGNGDDGVAIG